MASKRTFHLTQPSPNLLGDKEKRERERERERERKKMRDFIVRSSHFSLDFSAIEPAASDETRGKVDSHYKSYAWVLVLWSFGNSKR